MTTSSYADKKPATMFDFHLEMDKEPQPNVRGLQIYNEDYGGVLWAVSAAHLIDVKLTDGQIAPMPLNEYQALRILWESQEEKPERIGNEFFNGRFHRGVGGKLFVRARPTTASTLSLRTRTGLFGGPEKAAGMMQAMPSDPKDPEGRRRLLHPHGFYIVSKMEGIADHFAESDLEFTPQLEDGLARHLAGRSSGYRRTVPTELGEVTVYAQRVDIFNTERGAQLLGHGCTPDTLTLINHKEVKDKPVDKYVAERISITTAHGKKLYALYLETKWEQAQRDKARAERRKIDRAAQTARPEA